LARRTTNTPAVAPTLPPERALPAIRKHLKALQSLCGRNYQEAHASEQEWSQFAQSLIEMSFGNPSSNLTKLSRARSAGEYRMIPYGGGIPHGPLFGSTSEDLQYSRVNNTMHLVTFERAWRRVKICSFESMNLWRIGKKCFVSTLWRT
jgi:hypothetical protein